MARILGSLKQLYFESDSVTKKTPRKWGFL